MAMDRPPCWREGEACPNDCAARLYRRVIYNDTTLHGPWQGWRMAGARLIAPSRDWIAPHQLDRVLWRIARFTRYD